MIRVLISGIGGSIGIDVARSLRADASIQLIGADCGEWGRRVGERLCDEVISLPRGDRDPARFAEALFEAIRQRGVDFAFVNPDPELEALSVHGAAPPCAHALPEMETIGIFLDKARTCALAEGSGTFPKTVAVREEAAWLQAVFEDMGNPLWLRATIGPGGRGSAPVETPEEALAWIAYWRRRGWTDRWMLQAYLPGRNLNWNALFYEGERVAVGSMERLRYFLGSSAVSGVSGQVSLCATIDPDLCAEVAEAAIRAIDPRPHGLYGVDLRGDAEGGFLVTEINPRLAGRPFLQTRAGVNLPLAAVRRHLGIPVGDAISPGGLQVGLHLSRQLDVDPTIGMPEVEAP